MITYHPHNKIELIKNENNSFLCDSSALKKQNINYVNFLPYNKDLKLYIPTKILYKKNIETQYHYLLSEFLEGGWISYFEFIDICLAHNINHVVDVGCALGVQSLLFNQQNITYHGIDILFPFFDYYIHNNTDVSFNIHRYPFDNIFTKELLCNNDINRTAIISSLCMYWVIDKDIEEQLYYMRKFRKAILHIPNTINLKIFKKYYNIVDIYYKNFIASTIYLERIGK